MLFCVLNCNSETRLIWTPKGHTITKDSVLFLRHFISYSSRTVKLERNAPSFSSFNLCPCPSLSSIVTDDRKQFQYLNIVLSNKTGPFFVEFS